jgi:hypothetical protein
LFEDQNRSNPTPDQDDPAGSLIDAQMLSQYVHLTARDLAAYRGRLVTIFACADLARVFVVGTKQAVEHFTSSGSPLDAPQLPELALSWLASA